MAVTFDAVGPGSSGSSAPSGNPPAALTWSHTISGSNRLVVVTAIVSASTDAGISLSVTFGGVAMNATGAIHSNNSTVGFMQMFWLIAPATGAQTVSVSGTAGSVSYRFYGGSVSFNGVDQTYGVRNIKSVASAGVNPSVTVVSYPGNMVVDGICNGNSIPVSNQTVRWSEAITNGTAAGNGGSSTADGLQSVTMNYTTANDQYAMIAMDVISVANLALCFKSSPYLGIFSKDSVLSCGAFDMGVPNARYGWYDDDFVAQFSGTTAGATVSGITSVPPGVFSKDATLDGAFDD